MKTHLRTSSCEGTGRSQKSIHSSWVREAPLGRDGVGFPLSQEEQGFTPVVGRVEAEEGGGQRSLGSGAGYGGEDLPWAMGMRGQLWLG